jgi:uncharacterized protein YbjT (DUF2867 family)
MTMDNSETVLVLGATGSTGKRVTRQLRDRGVVARAAARQGEVQFDWTRPDTWQPALAGVSAIYLMAPDGVPVEQAFVAEAVERGVERLVLLSSMSIEEMGDDRLLAAERLVRDSGTAWTILRANWFNQNFDESFFLPAILAGELALPLGDVRQAFVDAEDIAAVAVEALTTDGHAGMTYEMTGPQALTFGDAVGAIAQARGREVRYLGDADAYRAAQQATGASTDQIEAEIAAYASLMDSGDAVPTDTIERVTGRPPIPFAVYAAEAARRGAWLG